MAGTRKKKVKEDSLGFLKQYLETNKDEFIYELTFEGKVIEIKTYLPYLEKLSLVEQVTIGSFLQDENGITKYNCGFRELLYNYNLIRYYTNLELNSDFTEIYDLFKQSGLLDQILLQIPLEETTTLEYLINEAIEEEFHLNKKQEIKEQSFGFVASALITQITEFFSNLDPEKIDEIVKAMGNLPNVDILRGIMDGKIK